MRNKEDRSNEKFEELCAGYVLDTLDEDEHDAFELMLPDATNDQRRLYQELWSVANQLAFTVKENESSESMRERLMKQIRAETGKREPRKPSNSTPPPAMAIDDKPDTKGDEKKEEERTFNWATFSAAASFALLIVSLSLLFYSFNLSAQINDSESLITAQKARITELSDQLQQKEEMLAILKSPDVGMVPMAGLEINPDGYGKIIWDAESRQALLQVSNLPPVPAGKEYQLWIISNNEPVSAGVFAVNDSSDSFFKMEEMTVASLPSPSASNTFAVTLEPKGGVPQPTGEMYLLGDMEMEDRPEE